MRQMSTLCRRICLNIHRWWGWWRRLKAFSFVKLKALPKKLSKVCISLKRAASLNSTLAKFNIMPSSHVKLMKHRALLHVVISLAASSMSCLFTLNKTSSSCVVFFSEHMSCCCIEHFCTCDLMMRHLLKKWDGRRQSKNSSETPHYKQHSRNLASQCHAVFLWSFSIFYAWHGRMFSSFFFRG